MQYFFLLTCLFISLLGNIANFYNVLAHMILGPTIIYNSMAIEPLIY